MRHVSCSLLAACLLLGAVAGCRTRLPVEAPASEPARGASVSVRARELAERSGTTGLSIPTDRLRDLVTYRPLARPGDGPLGFVLRASICVPGEDDR